MQWFGARHDESPGDFRRQTAAKRGGEIGFITYALLLGRSGGKPLGLGGLLYTVGDTVWFEDFERDNWFSRIIANKSRYEKTELSFARSEVAFTRAVSRSSAERCMGGRCAPESLPAQTALAAFFSSTVTQVHLRDGSSLFFEVMLRKEFMGLFAKA
jgi:hypothetical protein